MAMDTILASVHVFDPELGCEDGIFQPCSATALRNFKRVEDEFRYHANWPINKGIPKDKPVSLGLYKEDSYKGGHPWYLLVLAASEFLSDAAISWEHNGVVEVTSTSLPFFEQHVGNTAIQTGRYEKGSNAFDTIVKNIKQYAYEYFMLAESHIPEDGSISEQYHNTTGKPWSVDHLTWSHVAWGTASDKLQGVWERSWYTGKAAADNFNWAVNDYSAHKTAEGDFSWENEEFGYPALVQKLV